MLPTLEDRFEAVAVGVENVGRVVSGIVIEPCSRFAGVAGSGLHGGSKKGVDIGFTVSDEAYVDGLRIGLTLPQPEEDSVVSAESLKVGVPRGSVLSFVVEGMFDAERSQRRFIKGYRATDIRYREEDMIQHFYFADSAVFFRVAG